MEATESRPDLLVVPDQSPILLRVEEAAWLLGYGRTTVYEMVASGELAAIRRGRTTRIPRRALDEWIARELVRATGD